MLVNQNKSISSGKVVEQNNSLILAQYTALLMSNGGVLVDENGEILGIHFGNYYDCEKREKITKKNEDSSQFDIFVE